MRLTDLHQDRKVWVYTPIRWEVFEAAVVATATFPEDRAFVRDARGAAIEVSPRQCHASRAAAVLAAREEVARCMVDARDEIVRAEEWLATLASAHDRLVGADADPVPAELGEAGA